MDLPPFEIVYLKSAESPIHAEPKQLDISSNGRIVFAIVIVV